MRWIPVVLLAGCRMGFEPVSNLHADATGSAADDAQPGGDAGDAPLAIPDGPVGAGTYAVTDTTATYTLLASPTVVPGFAVPADDESYGLPLPFPFTYYGVTYTNVYVSMNGYVTFAAPPSDPVESFANDCPAFDGVPDATIALFWDDLYASAAAPAGALGYAVTGSAPARTLTIEWRDMDAFYQIGMGKNALTQGIRVTQAIRLHENGVIELHYGPRTPPTVLNQDCGPNRHLGCSATVGIERPGAGTGTPVQCGTATMQSVGWTPLADGRLITFTPQ